jgi:hypothetical protein
LFALAAKESNIKFVFISYIAVPLFWLLDGFFISRERCYRELFKEVAQKEEGNIDFNMDVSDREGAGMNWLGGCFSKTLVPFYLFLLVTIVVVMFFMR